MNIGKYRVHRVSEVPQNVTVTFEGVTTGATIMGLEVELTPVDDAKLGTLTLRFVGPSVETARVEFLVDAEGDLTWSADQHVEAPPVEAPPVVDSGVAES